MNLDETSYNSSVAIGTVNNSSKGDENGAIKIDDDSFTASKTPLKIKWTTNEPASIGYGPLVTGIDGLANATSLFDFDNSSYGFYADGDNLKLAQAYTLTVGEAKAATLVLPFASRIPSGIEAYTLTHTDGKDYVNAALVETNLAADTPVLINSEKAQGYKFVCTSNDATTKTSGTAVSGVLTGVYALTTVPSESYILYKGDSGLGFYKATGTQTVAANRAYMTPNGSVGLARLAINFDGDDTTGIEAVSTQREEEIKDNVYYDLSGRRVAQPTKGLYIVNGKKVIIK